MEDHNPYSCDVCEKDRSVNVTGARTPAKNRTLAMSVISRSVKTTV